MGFYTLKVFAFGLAFVAFGCGGREAKRGELPAGDVASPSKRVEPSPAELASPPDDSRIPNTPSTQSGCDASFQLCAAYLKTAMLFEEVPDAGESRVVSIELTEEGRQSFETFTRTWLRRNACIVLRSELLVAARVQVAIPSGRITLVRATEREAQEVVNRLQAAPAAPCGP